MPKVETAQDLADLLIRSAETALQNSTRIWVQSDGLCFETNGRDRAGEVGAYRRILPFDGILRSNYDLIAQQIHLNVEMLRQKGFSF